MASRIRPHVALLLAIILAGNLGAAPRLKGAEAGPLLGRDQRVRGDPATGTELPDGMHLLSSTSAGVTLQLNVPWERLSVERVTTYGHAYSRVSLPGWETMDQPGAPALPFLSQLLGVPVGAHVSVRVVPGKAHSVPLCAPPLPSPRQEVAWGPPWTCEDGPCLPTTSVRVEEDAAVYGEGGRYPGALAEVTSNGMVRQQRVVAVTAHPLQYYPKSNQLIIYESLRIEITFEGGSLAVAERSAAERGAPESAAYESLFRQQLLNYESARACRSIGVTSGPSPGDGRGEPFQGAWTARSALKSEGVEGVPSPWAPPDPGWRIKVRDNGFYRLTYDELDAAGLPVDTLDPQTFQVYHLGRQVAIHVEGEGDGTFDPTDYVLFYGEGLASKYTADNVYWLTYDRAAGLRLGFRDGTPGSGMAADHYLARRHMERNAYYIPKAAGEDALERWQWDYVYTGRPEQGSWTHTFHLSAPSAEPATLTVAMLGYLDNPIEPDHHAEIAINGTQVGDAWWDGMTWQIEELEIPEGVLVGGDNSVHVTAPNDTGVGYDLFYIDWVELEYGSAFVAEDGELGFTYDDAGTWSFQIDGFNSDKLEVYDVTDPAAVVRLDGVEASGSGPYSAVFQDRVTAPTDYHVLAEPAYRTVQAIEADTASNLASTANGADHIVITHRDFSAEAGTLRDHRASQGLRAVWVDVQDVYDEFGYGIEGVAPIRDFLAYSYGNWEAPRPSFVVLLGDGHYDPKNHRYSRVSYIHPYLAAADPWLVETAVDNRYVTVVGDDTLPDMMVGRLAVNTSSEASAFVDKIISYEEAPVPDDWQRQVLAVADNPDGVGDFPQMSDSVLSCCVPETYSVEQVYYGVTHTTVSAARTAIQTGINAGKLIVNYIGHAAPTQWADEGLLKATDVGGLSNGNRLPVLVPMTCYDGYYHYPHTAAENKDALAEVVTRAEGKGAVASWSPTGLGVATGHGYLNRGFFRAVFQEGVSTLGEATTAGKLNLWASGSNLDLLDTYLLFGDPALELPVEGEEQADLYVEKTGPEKVGPGETIAYTIAWGNSAEVAAPGAVMTDTLPAGVSYVGDDSGWARSEPEEGVIVWTVAPDPMPAGASGSFVVTATVGSEVEGSVVNEVRIAGTMSDANPADNEDQWVTEVRSDWRVYLPVVVKER